MVSTCASEFDFLCSSWPNVYKEVIESFGNVLFLCESPVIVNDSRGESLTFGFSFNKSTNKFPSFLKVIFVL